MTLQELLQALDVEFLEGGHHHCRPGWVNLDCPFCRTQGKFHLGYNIHLGYFSCWQCGGHHVISTLTALGASNADSRAFYAEKEVSTVEVRSRKRQGLVEPPGRGPLKRAHRNYLRGRGFDPDELERIWNLEGLAVAGRLSWRVYIPILWRGKRVSWTARAIGEEVKQRYLSASAEEEAVNHKHICYGLDYCLHSVVVVEGPTDAWRIGPGAAAVFGTAFSSAQVLKLVQIPNRFVCFDSGRTAQAKAQELCNQLSLFDGNTTNIEIGAKDPGSASPAQIKKIRKLAML